VFLHFVVTRRFAVTAVQVNYLTQPERGASACAANLGVGCRTVAAAIAAHQQLSAETTCLLQNRSLFG
jgi:hypothetical protein